MSFLSTEHGEHYARTALILVLFLSIGAAWAFGDLEPGASLRLEGMLGVLLVALLDAGRVATKKFRATEAEKRAQRETRP
jgi:hypothetical protein